MNPADRPDADSQRRILSRMRSYLPPRNGPCLCGSGLKFKRCCADRLPTSGVLGRETHRLMSEHKFHDALLACRADLTQYTIWHRAHTELTIGSENTALKQLLKIDLNAMAEIVDRLMFCYKENNMIQEFPAVLERLRSNMHVDATIAYYHSLNALGPSWNEEAGRVELRKLGPPLPDDNVEVLQLYLDLFGDELSFSEKDRIIDDILARSDKLGDWLHYKGAKAVLYLVIGDRRRAEDEVREAVHRIEVDRDRQELGVYGLHRFAQTLGLLGMIGKDKSPMKQSIRLIDELLADQSWSPEGRANLISEIGENYRHLGEWQQALTQYERAIEIYPRAIYRVFLCQCLAAIKMYSLAQKTLLQIDAGEFTQEEHVDYVFIFAFTSITIGSRPDVIAAIELLKLLKINNPYFREHRDSLLLSCQEYLSKGTSRPLRERVKRLFLRMAMSASSYLIVQPSFMGVGLDIGKLLHDFAQKSAAGDAQGNHKSPQRRDCG